MRIQRATALNAPPEWVATQLQRTAVFRHITAPLMHFTPVQGAPWPEHWAPGDTAVQMRLLGVVPMGVQTVRVSIEPAHTEGGWPTLRDNGEGTLMRRWDHRISLRPLPDGRTLYTDDIEVVARHLPLMMTPLSAGFAQGFFWHRQRRLGQLADQHAADVKGFHQPSTAHRHRAFDHLLAAFANPPDAQPAVRWLWLEAAHVLGQPSLPLHWRAHVVMLRYAWSLRHPREITGQLLRLALVPLGHLLARLPAGNNGRAHVNAFRRMEPSAEVAALIQQALDTTAGQDH